jgi:hypothetical protein
MDCYPLSTTAEDVKLFLQDRRGHPVAMQLLMFMGRRLERDAPLSSYGVTKDCTIQLHLLHAPASMGQASTFMDHASSSALGPLPEGTPVPAPAPFSAPMAPSALGPMPESEPKSAPAPLSGPDRPYNIIDLTKSIRYPCFVCGVNSSGVMLQPCLHTCICTQCVMQMGTKPRCPKCSIPVDDFRTVDLFL